MKPSMDELRQSPSLLTEFNRNQVDTNRKEAEEVKKCFTTQTHQALMVSAAIMGLGARFLTDPQMDCYVLAVPAILVIILCLATARIGCHKYNTANRTTAYQIHLARIVDYMENTADRSRIARELRRVDWEEAMFAWRVVQPAIYSYFYIENEHIGLCLKRFTWGGLCGKRHDLEVGKAVKEYPWYDSRELLAAQDKKQASICAGFYPGSYLRKMLVVLYTVASVCWGALVYSLYCGIMTAPSLFGIAIMVVIAVGISGYGIKEMLFTWLRCRILESGLLSIQTSAFVWRIVCISHVLARLNAKEANAQNLSGTPSQLYNGYTCELGKVASADLCKNLHRIHEWLEEKERDLTARLPRDTVDETVGETVTVPPAQNRTRTSRKAAGNGK